MSKFYGALAALFLFVVQVPAQPRHWQGPPISDQGRKPYCVTYAINSMLQSEPFNRGWVPNPEHMYIRAQDRDGFSDREKGTYAATVLQILKEDGYIGGYVRAEDLAATNHLLANGPVVVTSNWHSGMDLPYWDTKGIVDIRGRVRSKHEWLLLGPNKDNTLYEGQNSWGLSYGLAGRFFIKTQELRTLLDEPDSYTMQAYKR